MSKLKVYTGGTFDLFHHGHVRLLKRANKLGKVYVALNTDEFVKAYKGRAPIMSYKERKEVLESCRYVYKVIKNVGGRDSKPSILSVKPNVIIIGSDWKNRDYLGQLDITDEFLKKNRIKLLYVPYTKDISSTEIKCRI